MPSPLDAFVTLATELGATPNGQVRALSRAGFDGGLDPRILSSGEETLRRYGPSEEVSARVA